MKVEKRMCLRAGTFVDGDKSFTLERGKEYTVSPSVLVNYTYEADDQNIPSDWQADTAVRLRQVRLRRRSMLRLPSGISRGTLRQ